MEFKKVILKILAILMIAFSFTSCTTTPVRYAEPPCSYKSDFHYNQENKN